jgi:hypothetical protein
MHNSVNFGGPSSMVAKTQVAVSLGDRLKVASTSSRLGGIGSHLFMGLLGKCLAPLLLKSLPDNSLLCHTEHTSE